MWFDIHNDIKAKRFFLWMLYFVLHGSIFLKKRVERFCFLDVWKHLANAIPSSDLFGRIGTWSLSREFLHQNKKCTLRRIGLAQCRTSACPSVLGELGRLPLDDS